MKPTSSTVNSAFRVTSWTPARRSLRPSIMARHSVSSTPATYNFATLAELLKGRPRGGNRQPVHTRTPEMRRGRRKHSTKEVRFVSVHNKNCGITCTVSVPILQIDVDWPIFKIVFKPNGQTFFSRLCTSIYDMIVEAGGATSGHILLYRMSDTTPGNEEARIVRIEHRVCVSGQ